MWLPATATLLRGPAPQDDIKELVGTMADRKTLEGFLAPLLADMTRKMNTQAVQNRSVEVYRFIERKARFPASADDTN